MDDDEMSNFYSNIHDNTYGLLENEYIVIKNGNGDIVDNRKWNGVEYKPLSYKQIKNEFSGYRR